MSERQKTAKLVLFSVNATKGCYQKMPFSDNGGGEKKSEMLCTKNSTRSRESLEENTVLVVHLLSYLLQPWCKYSSNSNQKSCLSPLENETETFSNSCLFSGSKHC